MDVKFSITALLDLLGFSEHLTLGSGDIRTKIGTAALDRLRILEKAIVLAESDIKKYPQVYSFRMDTVRLNDSIYFMVDLSEGIIPPIGSSQLSGGLSLTAYHKSSGKSMEDGFTKEILRFHASEGYKTALFIGLVARIHDYINREELGQHYPGCRTVVSTGYRLPFIDNLGKEDYFSANFSLSNAYLVNHMGSAAGISGNYFYVDDNIARVVNYDFECKSLMRYAKYIYAAEHVDPYEMRSQLFTSSYISSPIIKISLFKKTFNFRRLNTSILSNFRLMPIYKKYIKKDGPIDSLAMEILKCIKIPPKERLDNISGTEIGRKYPIFTLEVPLDEDIEEAENVFIAGIDGKKR